MMALCSIRWNMPKVLRINEIDILLMASNAQSGRVLPAEKINRDVLKGNS